MSAISGAYQQVDGGPLARTMSAALARRARGGEELFSFVDSRTDVHLVQRRTSGLHSDEPRPFSSGGLTICYDGELYNHRDLAKVLRLSGVSTATSSDAEVIVECWRRWGPACLRRLEGMFAFALFDRVSGSLYLVRDQLGIKPLYFSRRKDGVVFASELKALVAAFDGELHVEPAAMLATMMFSWVPEDRCSVSGVKKLRAGTWAEFQPDGSFRVRCYWDVAEVAAASAASTPPGVEGVSARLERSVASQVGSEVQAGCLLSGGVASGLVAAMAKNCNPRVVAYTVTLPRNWPVRSRPAHDPVRARVVAAACGVELTEVPMSPDTSALVRTAQILDEPTGDIAAIVTLLACEAARDTGSKVLLSGIGASELFGGRAVHAQSVSERAGDVPAPADQLPVRLREEADFRSSYGLFDEEEVLAITASDFRPLVEDVIGEHVEVYCDNYLDDRVNRMCLAEVRLSLPALRLAYTDRASAAASIEVRAPFLDPGVVRAAFGVPGVQKIRGGSGQWAVMAAARNWLPHGAAAPDGRAFSSRLVRFFVEHCGDRIEEWLLEGDLVGSGFLERRVLEQFLGRRRERVNSRRVLQLGVLELWYRNMRAAGVAL